MVDFTQNQPLSLGEDEMKDASKMTKRQIRRWSLLADVAEMHFVEKLTQKQISAKIGTTPSNVSRMISDAEKMGVIEVRINRPRSTDEALAQSLQSELGLTKVQVVVIQDRDDLDINLDVARAGSEMLRSLLKPDMNLGVTWGRTLLAIIEAFSPPISMQGNVIQLAGSIGAIEREFDSVSLVQRLATLTKSRPVHLNAPFVVEDARIAASLRRNVSNLESHQMASACDIVVVGVGSTDRGQSSLFASGFLSDLEIDEILDAGAVGEICGHPIDVRGCPVAPDFSSRVVSIGVEDLAATKIKLAVTARPHLAKAIYAACIANCISHLVVDSDTAQNILSFAKQK